MTSTLDPIDMARPPTGPSNLNGVEPCVVPEASTKLKMSNDARKHLPLTRRSSREARN